MGVLGLWQLLAPVGQPTTLESLENKIFAVDISIWLNQALKGYRDSQGGSVPNAHLLSLFSRLCKLLFFKIRPIIVFDGGYPELKKQTIMNRQHRREAVKQTCQNIGIKILANYIASQNLDTTGSKDSGKKPKMKSKAVNDDIFKLPPLQEDPEKEDNSSIQGNDIFDFVLSKEDINYLNKIDIDSDDFNSLPPDVKQEILSTLKENRKHRTWQQFEDIPKESNEFSDYQMQCLLKRRRIQGKLEEVQRDMRQASSADFISKYTGDHVISESSKIMSDDSSHYVLLKKIRCDISEDSDGVMKQALNSPSLSMMDTKSSFIRSIENVDVDDPDYIPDDFVHAENSIGKVCETDRTGICISVGNGTETFQENEEVNFEDSNHGVKVDFDLSNALSPAPPKSHAIDNIKIHKDSVIETSLKQDHVKECCYLQPVVELVSESSKMTVLNVSKVNIESGSSCNDSVQHFVTGTGFKTVSSINENNSFTSQDESNLTDEETMISCGENESSEESELQIGDIPVSEKATVNNTDQLNILGDQNVQKTIETESSANKAIFSDASSKSNNNPPTNSTSDEPAMIFLTQPSTSSPVSCAENNAVKLSNEAIQVNLQLQNDLEAATYLLEAEQAKQARQNRTVQEHMIEECKELLQLFGIPFIVSPMEAEAQCAFYDVSNLTHGTITDDSDVWLFGGKRVYKNFFSQHKYVELYKDSEILSHFGLSRKKLINFAMLTGSDYTEGIEGVGPVTAMEIISEFNESGIDALQNFKDWWEASNKSCSPPKNKVRGKLRKLVLTENFPDINVFEAYMNPEIDHSTESFTWGRPDLDALRDYAKERFNWNKNKVDDALLPVIKKLNERISQTHLDSFFTVSLKKETNLFPSKRIMSALKKIAEPGTSGLDNASKVTKRKTKSSKKEVTKKVKQSPIVSTKQCRKKQAMKTLELSEESSSDDDV